MKLSQPHFHAFYADDLRNKINDSDPIDSDPIDSMIPLIRYAGCLWSLARQAKNWHIEATEVMHCLVDKAWSFRVQKSMTLLPLIVGIVFWLDWEKGKNWPQGLIYSALVRAHELQQYNIPRFHGASTAIDLFAIFNTKSLIFVVKIGNFTQCKRQICNQLQISLFKSNEGFGLSSNPWLSDIVN